MLTELLHTVGADVIPLHQLPVAIQRFQTVFSPPEVAIFATRILAAGGKQPPNTTYQRAFQTEIFE
jgi:hypothetical protein